ncbi:MAG TPA: nuclear transport factor 2 family protein [Candidatus Binataceae bacterium]|nr:nuclear transport factor 2 family protein [Candidatus Binataceae bacterium]
MADPNRSAIEAEIEKLEHDEAAARVAGDTDQLDALWSDELIINATENIIYTKDHFLMRMRGTQIRFESFERTISRIAAKGDIVITTGNESIIPANGPDAGKSVFCSYMNVWIRAGAGWQLLGRQVAVIARASSTSGWVF